MDQDKRPSRVTSLRLPEGEHERLVARAKREDVTPSHLLRRLVTFGLDRMPDFWVPPTRGGKR